MKEYIEGLVNGEQIFSFYHINGNEFITVWDKYFRGCQAVYKGDIREIQVLNESRGFNTVVDTSDLIWTSILTEEYFIKVY